MTHSTQSALNDIRKKIEAGELEFEHEPFDLFRQEVGRFTVAKSLRDAYYRVHRGTNLMAHIGKELAFGLVSEFSSLFGLFESFLGLFALADITTDTYNSYDLSLTVSPR